MTEFEEAVVRILGEIRSELEDSGKGNEKGLEALKEVLQGDRLSRLELQVHELAKDLSNTKRDLAEADMHMSEQLGSTQKQLSEARHDIGVLKILVDALMDQADPERLRAFQDARLAHAPARQ